MLFLFQNIEDQKREKVAHHPTIETKKGEGIRHFIVTSPQTSQEPSTAGNIYTLLDDDFITLEDRVL